MEEKIVCVSVYANPIHVGHIRLFKEAKKLGTKLVVIVNNDKQAFAKKGRIIVSENDRMEIIMAIKWVDEVILAIDEDPSVRKTLRMINPDIFANGGDRSEGNVPEKEVCDELGIEMIDNVGGEKIDSSTDIVKRMEE